MEIKTLKYITISSFFKGYPEEFEQFTSLEFVFCFGTNAYSLISKTDFIDCLFSSKEIFEDTEDVKCKNLNIQALIEKALILPDDVYIDLEN